MKTTCSEDILGRLIGRAEASLEPSPRTDQILAGLRYFHGQLGSGDERRDRFYALVKRWKTLERFLMGTSIEAEAARDLAEVADRLGVPGRGTERARFERWRPGDFFRGVLADFTIRADGLPEAERKRVEQGLRYLLVETGRAENARDAAAIRRTWARIHPVLKSSGVMDQFNENPDLRARVRDFIRGGSR